MAVITGKAIIVWCKWLVACKQLALLQATPTSRAATANIDSASVPKQVHHLYVKPDVAFCVLQMRELCPYQNIRKAKYPAVLASCSVTDTRVPVWGPAKWIAKLREHQTGTSPILLLSSSVAGHFAHEADLLENSSLESAFLINALQQIK